MTLEEFNYDASRVQSVEIGDGMPDPAGFRNIDDLIDFLEDRVSSGENTRLMLVAERHGEARGDFIQALELHKKACDARLERNRLRSDIV